MAYSLEGMVKFNALGKYLAGLSEKRYEEVKRLNNINGSIERLLDLAKENKLGYYPNFSEEDIKLIEDLYNKYIIRVEEISKDENDPVLDDRDGEFTNYLETLSNEELDEFISNIPEKYIWIRLYCKTVITGKEEKNKSSLEIMRFQFSEEELTFYNNLRDYVLEGNKVQNKVGSKEEGGVKMAEETAHTPKEKWTSTSIGVTEETFNGFIDYVKGISEKELYEFLTTNGLDEQDYIWRVLENAHKDGEITDEQLQWMYPPEKKRFAQIINNYHKERSVETPEKTSTISRAEYAKKEERLRDAIIGKMAQQLGIEPKVLKPLIRTDVANADLLEACAFIKHSVEQNGQEYALGKLAEAHAKYHPDSKDNPFDLKNLSPEEKEEIAAQAKETQNTGKTIAEDKIEKRKQEIKEVAEKYRAEMGQHVGENIKEIKSKIEELKSQQDKLLADRDDIKAELEKAVKELDDLQKDFEESTKGVQEDIDSHDEKISSIEKNSKALIKSEKKGRFARFISKLAEKFGFANEKKSKEDINAVLDGEKEAPKNKGFFETIGEAVQETRKDTKDNISSIKEAKEEKIAELAEKKEKLETQLAEAQAKLDDKESEIAKIRDSQQGKDDKILSQVKDAELEIESWEKEIKYLEKLQERIANLSDRKAYRLSRRGIDKEEGIDR